MTLRLPDPFELAARQQELDLGLMRHEPILLARKRQRLAASPLGFFRGSARLYYEILAEHRELRPSGGPSGSVVGDMHLENVGAYRTDDDRVVFDLNDFDDAGVAPFWVDTQRLAVSVLLAGRSFQASGPESIALVEHMLDAYDAAFAGDAKPPAPKPIVELCEHARRRTRKALLDLRAPRRAGKRRFVRGPRYLDLGAKELRLLPSLVGAYVRALGPRAPAHASSWKLVDVAQRVAGNGSLGRRRYAFVVRDDRDVDRIFELKEAAAPSIAPLFGAGSDEPAARVVSHAQALTRRPPRQLAALKKTALGSFYGRKLCPEEDKLDLESLRVGPKLSGVVALVGDVLGRAHAHAIVSRGAEPMRRTELIDRVIVVAGIFEAVYLAHARRAHVAAVARAKPRAGRRSSRS